jgi:homoserine dehydrogenase
MPSSTIHVGLIGFGTVGTGVVEFLLGSHPAAAGVQLKTIAVRDLSKPRELPFPRLTECLDDILEDPEIRLVVELMGGEEPARTCLLRALRAGKSVVTANKLVVSRHLPELVSAARESGADLAFEAAVAGSIPVIRTIRGFLGERFTRITGILNGTSNYILSRMEEGMDFDHAVRLAQEKGFAEADHTLDTGGFDARDKLAILAGLAFDTYIPPEQIHCEGINGITPIDLDFAAKSGVEEGGPGYAVKSLATAQLAPDGALEAHVYPALISRNHPLAAVRNEMNAVYLEGERCGPQLYLGRGAGRHATASAVISDLLRLARNLQRGVSDPLPSLQCRIPLADIRRISRRGYVRMNLRHIPGSIAEASRILGAHGFNIEDSVQRRRFRMEVDGEVYIPDIITVEPLPFGVVGQALQALRDSQRVKGEPFYLRFED